MSRGYFLALGMILGGMISFLSAHAYLYILSSLR